MVYSVGSQKLYCFSSCNSHLWLKIHQNSGDVWGWPQSLGLSSTVLPLPTACPFGICNLKRVFIIQGSPNTGSGLEVYREESQEVNVSQGVLQNQGESLRTLLPEGSSDQWVSISMSAMQRILGVLPPLNSLHCFPIPTSCHTQSKEEGKKKCLMLSLCPSSGMLQITWQDFLYYTESTVNLQKRFQIFKVRVATAGQNVITWIFCCLSCSSCHT